MRRFDRNELIYLNVTRRFRSEFIVMKERDEVCWNSMREGVRHVRNMGKTARWIVAAFVLCLLFVLALNGSQLRPSDPAVAATADISEVVAAADEPTGLGPGGELEAAHCPSRVSCHTLALSALQQASLDRLGQVRTWCPTNLKRLLAQYRHFRPPRFPVRS